MSVSGVRLAVAALALSVLPAAVDAQTMPPGGWPAQPGGWKPAGALQAGPSAHVAQAMPQQSSTSYEWLSEFKVGLLAHDQGPFSHQKEGGADANFELLFTSPDFLKPVWAPRPHIGGNWNLSGDTSQVYAGLSWDFGFWKYGLFEFSLGGAYHNGATETNDPDKKSLGCHVLFRESIGLGVRFMERHSLTAYLDHISNAKLCSTNEGLENVGIRYGYRF